MKITNKAQEVLKDTKETQKQVKKIVSEGITKQELETLESTLNKMEKNLEIYNKNNCNS